MSLQFILGSSGSGKSTYIYKKIVDEAALHPDKKYVIIVPDQYTMETQSALVRMCSNEANNFCGCIMNIDILSFSRMAYRVFEELAMSTLDVLDDSGKVLIMRKLAEEHENELSVLKSNIRKPKYIEQIKSLISELCQYNITPERLQTLIDHPAMSGSFKSRAKDLLVLYKAFLDFISGRYLTNETILSSLCEVMENSNLIRDAVFVFDGFTGFTPVQYEVMKQLLPLAEKCYVTMTIDSKEAQNSGLFSGGIALSGVDKNDLFAMTKSFAIRMRSVAEKCHVEIETPEIIDGSKGRFSDGENLSLTTETNDHPLRFLEKNIFRQDAEKYAGTNAPKAIKIYNNSTPREELRQVAIEISKLIRDKQKNYHYSDIAVVCANPAAYAHMVPEMWDAYDIPYFLDIKNRVAFTPVAMLIDGLFGMLRTGFNRQFVFMYLRSGLAGLSNDEIDALENYVIRYNIRGGKYAKVFTYGAKKDADAVENLNILRERFFTPLTDIIAIKDTATVREIATVFYNLLTQLQVYEKLEDMRVKFEEAGDMIKADIYKQLYRKVLSLLDKMVAIIGDEKMSLEEFYEIYHTGLAGLTVSSIPNVTDSVIFGDIERTRLSGIKALFLIGAGDDAIPKPVENGGIISDFDRVAVEKIAAEQGLDFEMAPSDREKSFQQKFYLYLMLTKASERLFISYPKVNTKGEAVQKSYLIDTFIQMFGESGVAVDSINQRSINDQSLSRSEAFDVVCSLMRKWTDHELLGSQELKLSKEDLDRFAALLSWLIKEEKYETAIRNILYRHEAEYVSHEVMEAHNRMSNSAPVSGSATRFEAYGSCAYKYYLGYILGLDSREVGQLSPIDTGNFYHSIMQHFGEAIKAAKKHTDMTWSNITDEEVETYLEEATRAAVEEINEAFKESSTEKFFIEKLEATIRTNVEIIRRQIREGSFEPTYFEKIEKKNIKDEAGKTVASIDCKIDRIDVVEDEAGTRIRIVDYKSGNKDLDLNEVYEGISIQLPLYMSVALETLKGEMVKEKIIPSGMLYYHISDELFDNGEGLEGRELSDKIFASHRMSGYILSDNIDVEAHDNEIKTKQKSDIVPAAYTKNGTMSKTSHALTQEEFKAVTDYVIEKCIDTAEGISDGKFECSPFVYGQKNGCQYCPYRRVCGFTHTVPGYEYRILKRSKPEEVLEKMKGGGNDDSSTDNAE